MKNGENGGNFEVKNPQACQERTSDDLTTIIILIPPERLVCNLCKAVPHFVGQR